MDIIILYLRQQRRRRQIIPTIRIRLPWMEREDFVPYRDVLEENDKDAAKIIIIITTVSPLPSAATTDG